MRPHWPPQAKDRRRWERPERSSLFHRRRFRRRTSRFDLNSHNSCPLTTFWRQPSVSRSNRPIRSVAGALRWRHSPRSIAPSHQTPSRRSGSLRTILVTQIQPRYRLGDYDIYMERQAEVNDQHGLPSWRPAGRWGRTPVARPFWCGTERNIQDGTPFSVPTCLRKGPAHFDWCPFQGPSPTSAEICWKGSAHFTNTSESSRIGLRS